MKKRDVQLEDLHLDLFNFRTVPQASEENAIDAIITIEPEWFWALMGSLIDSGYLPTENIIVLESKTDGLVVKEGNRRVAALKLILGIINPNKLANSIPVYLNEAIAKVSFEWKAENRAVPCAIFPESKADLVDRIVTLTHGKSEQAGRSNWEAVARARHNRKIQQASEPALDILETYLKTSREITPAQAQRWSGIFPLSILDDAIKRLAPRFGVLNARKLADAYPKIDRREALDKIVWQVGTDQLSHRETRDPSFGDQYGLPPQTPAPPPSGPGSPIPIPVPQPPPGAPTSPSPIPPRKPKAVPANDPRHVRRLLRDFAPRGKNRAKLVTLTNEARTLKLSSHPHAFCFLLRSMLEISAKAYAADHAKTGGPKVTDSSGKDRKLLDVLNDTINHLIHNDKSLDRPLQGAGVELRKNYNLLSVVSMNQLMHGPIHSITATEICEAFPKIFPLLEAMNK